MTTDADDLTPLEPNDDATLSIIPASGRVAVTGSDGETWDLPLIGYAVTIERDTTSSYDTRIVPVILDEDGHPDTMTWYLAARGECTWRVVPDVP